VLTALAFSLPALGRALSVSPAALFRGVEGAGPAHAAPGAVGHRRRGRGATLALLVATLPDPRFGLAFVPPPPPAGAAGRRHARPAPPGRAAAAPPGLPLPLQLALAGLQQPHSPLRTALLSLGSALTLLVACTLVVATLLRTVNDTVPAQAPALVFYDVQTEQIPLLRETLQASPGLQAVKTAPLVLGRLVAVNGEALRDSGDGERARESRDEHKLSNRSGNFDDVVIDRGAWWPRTTRRAAGGDGRPRGRPAGPAGGRPAALRDHGPAGGGHAGAIYSQRRMQSRLWLEAIFSDGVLDPFITRHVGAAWMPAEQTLDAQDRLAAVAPNIATARTESLLRETRALMGRASGGLAWWPACAWPPACWCWPAWWPPAAAASSTTPR
jgi:putative ABC transport system permease protein